MDWKHLLAYITGTVDQELLLRKEYLVTENRILRHQITGRVRLTDGERKTLAEIGAGNIPVILVLNKIDLLEKNDEQTLEELRGYYRTHGYEKVIFISAATKQNIDELRQVVYEEVRKKHMLIYPNYASTYFGSEAPTI